MQPIKSQHYGKMTSDTEYSLSAGGRRAEGASGGQYGGCVGGAVEAEDPGGEVLGGAELPGEAGRSVAVAGGEKGDKFAGQGSGAVEAAEDPGSEALRGRGGSVWRGWCVWVVG